MDAITKYDIQGLYKVFNFEHYEAPLSRIARLTGTKQEEVEELLGVCQLVKDTFNETAYREYILAYDSYMEEQKVFQSSETTSIVNRILKGETFGTNHEH